MKTTISAALTLRKSLVERANQLKELEKKTSTKNFWEEKNKIEEPLYDVKLVDKKLVKINKALFKIDEVVKASNATTEIHIELDYDDLMSEIQ